MLDAKIQRALDAVVLDGAMACLHDLVELDRYQASSGIAAAARRVVLAAEDAGLIDIAIHTYPADGQHRFWSFVAPRAWTPIRARLSVAGGAAGAALHLDHAEQPFLLATYSAPTPPHGLHAPLLPVAEIAVVSPAGAVVLIDAEAWRDPALLPALRARGALGFISDGPCCVDDDGRAYSGRIELASTSDWFGFSVTHAQFEALCASAAQGAHAHVEIAIDREATMPVVTALLPALQPSEHAGELWITSHLCHPRPGANDNGSGIVGLIGVAATLNALAASDPDWGRRRRPIRFLWAPEFVGTAAFYQARSEALGAAAVPHAVLNLDMIGEDQPRCGSPFVVERAPLAVCALLTPMAELVVERVFAATAVDGGRWRSVPFLGYSDHALFAGPHWGCPAVQFAHWPDRYNHSAADTLDKVSPLEMRRAIAAAAVLLDLAADDYAALRPHLPALIGDWCARDLAAAEAGSIEHPQDWRDGYLGSVREGHRALHALAAAPSVHPRHDGDQAIDQQTARYTARHAGDGAARPLWQGPFNLRAMIGDLPDELRQRIEATVRHDKRTLAWLANMATSLDGHRDRAAVVAAASHAMRQPFDPDLASLLWQAWLYSGWIASPAEPGLAGLGPVAPR